MKFIKSFKHAFEMVIHSKLRSWLTILGIVIGVASVIAIISMGEGMQQQVTSQLSTLGGDILTVSPGFSRAAGIGGMKRPGGENGGSSVATEEEPVLDRTDLQAIKGLSDVALIDTNIRGNAEVYYFGKKGSVSVKGVDPSVWFQITTVEIGTGRMLGPADSNVVVIGGRIANDYFDMPVGVNQMLAINDRAFRVVGVLDDESRDIYMPIQAAYEVLDDKEKNIYDSFTIKVKDEDELDAAIENIESKLMIARHVTADKKDFTISSNKERQEQRAEMLSSMTIFLTAIAAVALIVGAVGIANTMFTSVLEKTKEIGIMKAIGARNSEVLTLFLLNSGLLGLMGGFIGVIFGVMLSAVLPALMGNTGGIVGRMTSGGTIVSMESVILALLISVVIGMVSGAIPAYKASKLKPVDALRYE